MPGRPIISQVATPTYYLGHLVDFFLLPFVERLPTYIKDTPAFIRMLEQTAFPTEAKICVYDVSNMYTVLQQDELVKATREQLPAVLNFPPLPKVKRETIVSLLELMLKNNIFEFDGAFYKQIIGCAMGQVPSPSCSDILMAKTLNEVNHNYPQKHKILYHGRYRDDGFMVFSTASNEEIHHFFQLANAHTEGVHFTYNICENEATFLDITVYKGGRFETTGHFDVKMYRKPTETFQYLHRQSAHPQAVFNGLVKGETLRIIRNCSDTTQRDRQLDMFHKKLSVRGYQHTELTAQSDAVANIPRTTLLQEQNQGKRKHTTPPLVFTTKFNPKTRGLAKALGKHWPSISRDPDCNSLFAASPMIAYKRHKNLGDMLISSKLKPVETNSTD